MADAEFSRMVLAGSPAAVRTPASIEIVPYARASCHDEVRRLYAESFGEEPWPLDWDDFDEFDPGGIFLARESATRRFIGYVICFRREDYGYISVVAVIPGFRRRNIGSALVRKAVAYLHSLRLTRIMIDVEADNTAAVAAYRKLGFNMLNTGTAS